MIITDPEYYFFYLCVTEITVILPVFLWVWSLLTHIEGGTLAEGFREQGAEEDIWT